MSETQKPAETQNDSQKTNPQTFDPKAQKPQEEAGSCCGACGGGGH